MNRRTRRALIESGDDYARGLVATGWDPDEAAEFVAGAFDLLSPLEALIPGPGGVIADEALDAATVALVQWAKEALLKDPARMRERADEAAALGHEDRAGRIRARADAVEARQAG